MQESRRQDERPPQPQETKQQTEQKQDAARSVRRLRLQETKQQEEQKQDVRRSARRLRLQEAEQPETEQMPAGDDRRGSSLKKTIDKGTEGIRHSAQSIAGSTRRREQENARKMQGLFVVLGVLVALLAAAIIYEIVLGNGIRETGAERMQAQQATQTELQKPLMEPEGQNPATEPEGQNPATEPEGQTSAAETERQNPAGETEVSAQTGETEPLIQIFE